MSISNRKKVLVSDFDGTISEIDFFHYAVQNLLDKQDFRPYNDYLNKKLSHIDALNQMFVNISLPKKDLDEIIETIPIREGFLETVNYCRSENIRIYIISAGADYYIKILLKKYRIDDYCILYTNKAFYSPKFGLQVNKVGHDHPFYSKEYGLSKNLIMKAIKENYEYLIFAGDGVSDLEPAKLSNKIFARDQLLKLCIENNIEATPFDTYLEILDHLEKM